MACHWAISRDVNELTIVHFKLEEKKGHFDAEWYNVSVAWSIYLTTATLSR